MRSVRVSHSAVIMDIQGDWNERHVPMAYKPITLQQINIDPGRWGLED